MNPDSDFWRLVGRSYSAQPESLREDAGPGLREAEEISIADIPPERLALIKRAFGTVQYVVAWHGIHGYIVEFNAGSGGVRLAKDTLKKLAADKNFRWIEMHDGGLLAVGF